MKVFPFPHPTRKKNLLFVPRSHSVELGCLKVSLPVSTVSAAPRLGTGCWVGLFMQQPSKPSRTPGILVCDLALLSLFKTKLYMSLIKVIHSFIFFLLSSVTLESSTWEAQN